MDLYGDLNINSNAGAVRAQVEGAGLTVETVDNPSGVGGSIDITSGDSSTSSGGSINITAGSGSSVPGGTITLSGGDNTGPTNGAGRVIIQGGQGGGGSGEVRIQTGLVTPTTRFQINQDGAVATTAGGAVTTTIAAAAVGTGGAISMTAGQGGSTGAGGAVTLTAGAGGSTSGAGGAVTITSGSPGPGSDAGNIFITAADAVSGNADGGLVSIAAGATTGTVSLGAVVDIRAGNHNGVGEAGFVYIQGGTPTDGNGGDIFLAMQNGVGTNRDGGALQITTGEATGTGNQGKVQLSTFGGGFIEHEAGFFTSSGDARTRQYVARTRTTNATITEMFLDGTAGAKRMVLTNDSTWKFDIHVVARREDVDDEGAAYKYEGAIDRNTGAATIALIGSPIETIVAEDSAAWSVTVDADTTNGALRIQVTGEAAKTIRWVAFIRTVEVTG